MFYQADLKTFGFRKDEDEFFGPHILVGALFGEEVDPLTFEQVIQAIDEWLDQPEVPTPNVPDEAQDRRAIYYDPDVLVGGMTPVFDDSIKRYVHTDTEMSINLQSFVRGPSVAVAPEGTYAIRKNGDGTWTPVPIPSGGGGGNPFDDGEIT